MAGSKRTQPGPKGGIRRLLLIDDDIAAAQRLLALLSEQVLSRSGQPHSLAPEAARRQALEQARYSFVLRHRRAQILGPKYASEAPFHILLTLYVTEDREPDIIATRLTSIAGLPSTTVLRWLEPLASDGLINRKVVAGDRRKAQIGLSEKGRKRLDELFAIED